MTSPPGFQQAMWSSSEVTENEQREIAEAADTYMKEQMEEVRSDEELVELLEGLEEGTMVHIIIE